MSQENVTRHNGLGEIMRKQLEVGMNVSTKPARRLPVMQRRQVRLAGALLVGGEFVAIVSRFFHARDGGNANHHSTAFSEYAASDLWLAAHIGLFASGLLTVAGLIVLGGALAHTQAGHTLAPWIGLGAVLIGAAEGLVLVVDGVALKQAVDAWASATGPEKTLAFQDAETVRWLEWGVLSFLALVQGFTLLLLGLAIKASATLPKWLSWISILTGLCYLAVGAIVGQEGFSATLAPVGITTYVLTVIIAIGVAVTGWRAREADLAERAAAR